MRPVEAALFFVLMLTSYVVVAWHIVCKTKLIFFKSKFTIPLMVTFKMDDLKDLDDSFPHPVDVAQIKFYLQKGDAKLALHSSQILLAEDPNQVQVLLFATIAARTIGWLDEAFTYANNATVIAPDQPAAFSLLGDILLLQKKPDIALDILLHAHNLGDHTAQNYFNLGSAYMALEAFEKAKMHFNHALKINPEMAEAWTNLGVAEHSLMRLAEAIKCFDAALWIDPRNIDAKWNKSHVLLTQGNYQEGLKLYEIRWQNPRVRLRKRNLSSPLWLGQEDLSGKTLLLHSEGGFGDTLQFIRYAKIFRRDVDLIIQCQAPLVELISNMGLSARVISQGEPPPEHDFNCPLMSLPLAFGHVADSVPNFPRYIHPSSDLGQKWKPFIDKIGNVKIGVMVRGSGSFNEDKRSIDLEQLESYLPSNAGFVLLQKELVESEEKFIASRVNWVAPCSDFSETAAICELLDVVVSVDTSIAHLAAAMGKPTLLLLPFRPDWRWGDKGKSTSWYPSCTILRQTHRHDWKTALKSVRPAITKMIS